ncbi:nucleotidyltransferase domain-containing protein [Candidatus Woesearchaeota archaeon]|nr:nucleotidyltransferase domain-containing protein [Candidatus Woesearchaeota archaeon]
MVSPLLKQAAMAVAYAHDFLTFLSLDGALLQNIRFIFLFGSAVRGELEGESDIDLFIDCRAADEAVVKKGAERALNKFYASQDYEKWKSLHFFYPISFKAGDVHAWQLKTSIAAEGIVMYGKQPSLEPLERVVLFRVKLPKEKSKYLSLARSLYGREEKYYKNSGILAQAGGTKIGPNAMLVPQENQKAIVNLLNKEKIEFSMKELGEFPV